MLKQNILDEYWNDVLYLFMFHIAIHSIFSIYTPDINTNHFGAYILLIIVKMNLKTREEFKHWYR